MQENCRLKKISPALLIFIFLSFSFLSNGIQEDFDLNKTDEQLIQKYGNDYTTTEKQITFFYEPKNESEPDYSIYFSEESLRTGV
jgi:hypothetical protein